MSRHFRRFDPTPFVVLRLHSAKMNRGQRLVRLLRTQKVRNGPRAFAARFDGMRFGELDVGVHGIEPDLAHGVRIFAVLNRGTDQFGAAHVDSWLGWMAVTGSPPRVLNVLLAVKFGFWQ